MPLIFVLLSGVLICGDRVKIGEELMGSTYGNCANLALRCCNVPVSVASAPEALYNNLVAAVMADSTDATRSTIPKLVR